MQEPSPSTTHISEPCVYCHATPAATRDHVIPRALFHPPLPDNLITVPACLSCNQDKARDDSFLRDYLTTDFVGIESKAASQIFQGKVRRSISRNSSELIRSIGDKLKPEPFYTKGGIYLGEFYQAPVDDQRIANAIGRMLRGLYAHYGKQLVPPTYEVKLWRIMPWDIEPAWQSFQRFKLNACAPMGDVFGGACARVLEEILSSFWLVSFYGRVHFVATVFHPDLPEIVRRHNGAK
jgi:hypothetical protein